MTRTDSLYSSTEAALINLTNLVSRLEGNLLSSSEYQQQLLESEFQRDRVAAVCTIYLLSYQHLISYTKRSIMHMTS